MKNLFDRAKLFFSKDREFRSALYDIMGFCPHNIDLYRTAFAHKSQEYRSKKLGNKPLNNERLEFLGDAVLETVVSHIVYRHFPNKREGFLTNTRSKIVSRESLGRLAKELHIDRLIQSQTHSRTHNSYLGGNSFEALMGAIYLDRGFHYAFRFVEKRIIGAVLDLESVASKEVNFKSKLLEWSQKNRIRLEFKDTAADHDKANGPSFLTTVVIEGLYAGEGKGYSKKESHQAAAKDALTKLRREPQFLDGVFRAKEKRTAMGAEEFFVLPKIDEIEAEIAQEQSEGNSSRKEQGRGERNRKDHRGEQRGERNEKRNERQKDNREEKNAERRNGKNRGEQRNERNEARNEQSEETPKHQTERNTERKERRNKNAEARKEREGREGREERRQSAERNNDDHAKKAPVADHQSTEKRNEAAQAKEAEVQPTPAPERVEQPKVEVPAPQHEPAPDVQEAPAVETPQTVEAIAETTAAVAPTPQVTVPATEEAATTAPQPQPASTHTTDQSLPDTRNILPQSDRIEAQGTETPAAVEKSAPAEQTAVFAPMELPAEAVSATQEASVQTSTREVEEQHTTANTAQSEPHTPEVPVTAPHSETRTEEVSTVTAPEVEPFEASPHDAEVAPTESELIEIELTETPAPRTEQQKKRARRQNKAQNAAGYTNTALPPAEQSRRAEKAERKQREEAHRRAVERAHSELAEAPENADEVLDAESPAEQPAARRNNRRRRGGARRRKPGRNNEGNGTTQHEGSDN